MPPICAFLIPFSRRVPGGLFIVRMLPTFPLSPGRSGVDWLVSLCVCCVLLPTSGIRHVYVHQFYICLRVVGSFMSFSLFDIPYLGFGRIYCIRFAMPAEAEATRGTAAQ